MASLPEFKQIEEVKMFCCSRTCWIIPKEVKVEVALSLEEAFITNVLKGCVVSHFMLYYSFIPLCFTLRVSRPCL